MGVLPSNQRQCRPLTKLDPEDQGRDWEMVEETAPDGKTMIGTLRPQRTPAAFIYLALNVKMISASGFPTL